MTAAVVITIPADRVDWGQPHQVDTNAMQQVGFVYEGPELVCSVTVCWRTDRHMPIVSLTTEGRHAGPHD